MADARQAAQSSCVPGPASSATPGSSATPRSSASSGSHGGTRPESLTVLLAGLVQGIVLVAFPASEAEFVAPGGFGLDATRYGLMFLPQVMLAILTSVAGGAISRRLGLKRVFVVGLSCDVSAMAVLALSAAAAGRHPLGYLLLLVATGLLGAGFGLTVPTLNTLMADLRPTSAQRSVLLLNALLGLGTALAPVLGGVFGASGAWWGLPVTAGALAALVLVVGTRLPLATPPQRAVSMSSVFDRGRFWVLATAALAYGIVETMAGNWSQPLARQSLHLSSTTAAAALTVFWATVTLGRIVASIAEKVIAPRWIYRILPLVIALAYLLVFTATDSSLLVVLVFAVAGIGCSAMLPQSVSVGQQSFASVATAMSALVIAFYQLGYGIAAFGVGPLRSAGLDLPAIFGVAALVALILAGAAFALSARTGPASRTASPT